MMILDYIPFGRANAITARELTSRTGYPTVRALQQEIHRLRESGSLILSATEFPQGYYQPENDHEIVMFCRSMQSRITEIQKAVRPAWKYLNGDGDSIG